MKKAFIPVIVASILMMGCEDISNAANEVKDGAKEVAAKVEDSSFITEAKEYKESFSELLGMDISLPEEAKKVEDQLTELYVCFKDSTNDTFADKFINTIADNIEDPTMGELLDRAIKKAENAAACTQ